MKGLTPRNDHEREFMKVFDGLCYGQSRYKVWDDFVHMTALSIVNTVDKRHFEEREKRFLAIRKPYTDSQFSGFAKLFAITAGALEENPFQDFLGELYMRCDLGNDHTGQFFTPYHVCEMMAKIIVSGEDGPIRQRLKKDGYVALCDPCIGGGAMMIAGAQALFNMGINYQQEAVFACQDIDYTVAMMAYIQLSLIGCPGYVVVGNSLTEPMTGHALFAEDSERCFCTPLFFSEKMEFLRRMAIFKKVLYSIGGAEKPPDQHPEATVSKNETVQAEPVKVPDPPPMEEPKPIIVTAKKGRKVLEGQMMFDLMGGQA